MTPLGVTLLSVNLRAAGIVPSANNRFPGPSITGNTISQKVSTRSCFINVWSTLPLPQTWMSGPGCCLISVTFAAMSPPKNTDGCHSLEVLVFEATYLVAVITPGQCSE